MKQLREIQIRMLDVFVDICEKHQLKYWLDGGTLLGAVRHKGFIPWDDDIDVAMPIEDYNKFLEIAQKELPKDIFLQNNKTDTGYNEFFSKLRDNNSTFIEINEGPTNKYHQGIYIDIFPMVRYPLLPVFFLKFLLKVIKKTKQYIFVLRKKSFLYSLIYFSSKTSWTFFSLIKGRYYANFPENNWYNCIHKCSDLHTLIKVEFEGKQYNAPNNMRNYLIDLYGKDYLILPPKEKQITHAKFIDPNTPSDYLLKSK